MGITSRETPFPIVGIGASAGGLNSLQCFLAVLPKEFGFAVVFMQHLSTKHKSLLPELLHNRRPDIGISEISDGLKVLPGKLYLCPPGKEVRIRGKTFHVSLPSEDHVHLPIDEFFIALAEEVGERAIAVILSGAGTDGARGIQAVRDAGGTVFVQDPATAEFPAMPTTAVNTGKVDGVFPPEDIAREILKLLGAVLSGADRDITSAQFETFSRLIYEKTGYRFNHYKKNVVSRRIRRRMYLHGVSSVGDYIDLVAEKESEAANLASDLMIGVTSFLRDRLAWKALRIEVIRKLTADDDDQPVRVWTPACATGEEAYSIAMMLRHEFELAGRKREIQVFATDVNDRALEKAREGTYPGSITADVPPEYMKKFFTCSEDGNSVIIRKEIRESVVFARQDLLTDPPFSRLDLIICRNLLIYLEPEAQEKCIALFHYALKDGGYLFLGNAESVGRNSALFKSLGHKKCRVYRKTEAKPPARLSLTVPFASERPPSLPAKASAEYQLSVTEFVQQALLEHSGPAAVAIDQHYDIVYNNGRTNRYLRQPRGAPTQNLLELLPKNLKSRIRGALYRASQEARPVSVRAIIPNDDERKRQVTLRISKLRDNLFLVVFREKGGVSEEAAAVCSEGAAVDENAVRQLENELSATRADLRHNIEQLKSLNEELQSSNEELQAANEELETSREELQSLNEELITVNSQLQSKIEEQEETNNDLNNFLASTNIPTIFLDHQFRVKRFTPAMSRLIKLIPSDVGRPIIDMSQEGLGPELIADTQEVLDHLMPIKKEIAINGAWYIRATLPYRTSDNRIEGVVITYNDVSDLKQAEERTRHLASFPQLNPHPICEVDSSGNVTFCNPATQKILESLGLDKGDVNVFLPSDLHIILRELEKKEESSIYREMAIKDRVFGESIYLVPQLNGARLYAQDITERKREESVMQARLRLAEASYKGSLSADQVLRLTLDELELQTGSRIGFYHFLEEDQETLSLRSWSTNTVSEMCSAEGSGSHYNISQAGVWVDCVREKRPVIHNDYASLSHKKGMPNGHAPVIREMVVPIFRGDRIVAIIGVGNKETDYTAADIESAKLLGDFSWEIVERKRAEEALRESERRYHSLFENMTEGFAYCKMIYDEHARPVDFIYLDVNGAFGRVTGLENVVGKKVTEAIPGIKEVHPELFEIYGRVALAGRPERFEIEFKPLGMWLHVSVYSTEREYFVAVFDDITERKHAETELLRLNKTLKALSDSSQAVIRAKDEPEYLNEVCRIVVEDCGYSMVWIGFAENDEAKSVRAVAHAGFEDGYLETLQVTWADTERGRGPTGTAIRTGRVAACRNMMTDPAFKPWREQAIKRGYASSIVFPLTADDKVFGAITIYSKEADPFSEGEVQLLAELADDLSYGIMALRVRGARKEAEEALQKSLSRFELLTTTAGELLQSTEPQKVVESVCRKVMEYLDCHAFFNFLVDEQAGKLHLNACAGIPEEEAKRIEWLDFGVAVCGCAARDAVRIVAEHIPTTPDERTELVKSYGITAYCCHPLLGPGGKVIGTLSFGTWGRETFSEEDLSLMKAVTDQVAVAMTRMRNEADVLQLGEDMAMRNVELEAVNKELESFIYSISHDLRAPLRTIAGFVKILVEDYARLLDVQGQDYLARIHNGAEKMGRLIEDLLYLSKISRQEIRRNNVDMSKMASSIVWDLREANSGRNVDVRIKEGLTAFTDKRLIEIVLSNLLGNAWKFTSKTEEALIEFGALDQDGKTVYYVRDNGAGFDPKYVEKMFWPFHRLHSDKEFPGTGIGLTIVERIIHSHGGRVWAEGDKGKGATIYFTLGQES